MKQHELRARPKWHQRASPSEIDEVARIDRVIADLRRRRGKIINRVNMRTHVWNLQDGPRRHRVEAQGLALPFRPVFRLAQDEEPGLRGGEARGGRRLGAPTGRGVDRPFEREVFFSRNIGRLIWLHCSASSASLVQVRAMSSKMSRTRMFDAHSAICWHSAARSLHFAGVSTSMPHLA